MINLYLVSTAMPYSLKPLNKCLEFNKIVLYCLWHHYIKLKLEDRIKLWYRDIASVIGPIKSLRVYANLIENAEKVFDTSKYEAPQPYPKKRKKKLRI